MDKKYYINCIVEGIEQYFRTFALSGIIENHRNNIEWIKPLPGEVGPSIVYKVNLDTETIDKSMAEIVSGIKRGEIPSFWYVTPTATPNNIVDILKENGFSGEVPTNPEEIEYGMALDLQTMNNWLDTNALVQVKKVQNKTDFTHWINTVNTALHGWNMIDVEHYYTWVLQENLVFYVGYIEGKPAATAATIQNGKNASLEFVSTLVEYRNQGAATAVCMEAIKSLEARGVKTVILGSSPEATHLYKKLGFVPYFEKILLSYNG